MGTGYNPAIVTDGLILNLDAKDPRSYSESGNTWYDRSGNGNNATKQVGTFNSKGYFDSVYDANYYGGSHKLEFTVGHSTSLNDAFSVTSGGWSIEEIVRIDDNTYPEAAAGTVVSNAAYSSDGVGFDWNHGGYNTTFKMGVGNNVGEPSGYDVSFIYNLPTKFRALGQWLHRSLYWDRDSDVMGFYFNGEYIASTSIAAVSGQTLYDGGGISIGTLYGWVHQGARAAFRAYNKVLTSDEVLQNYNATKGRFSL